MAGRSSAWLERLLWEQEVAGSNPVAPISIGPRPLRSDGHAQAQRNGRDEHRARLAACPQLLSFHAAPGGTPAAYRLLTRPTGKVTENRSNFGKNPAPKAKGPLGCHPRDRKTLLT